MQAYLFNDYWEDIGTIKSLFDANLALTEQVGATFTQGNQFIIYGSYKPKATDITNNHCLPNLSDLDSILQSQWQR